MIAIQDLAYVRYQAPNLDVMESFLIDFGMQRSVRTGQALYMRGYGDAHHIHITERGDWSATLGFGLLARSAADLAQLAAQFGATVEDNPGPDSGQRIRLIDPVGFVVDVLHGRRTIDSLPHRAPIITNTISSRRRNGQVIRLKPAPSSVMRLGHLVLLTPDFKASFDFYTKVLGMKVSDSYYAGPSENMIAAFLHCGLGQTWTDHHTVALVAAQNGKAQFEHTAFEVIDFDDVVQGGEYLKQKKYKHSWGVGRHIQGSQLFDYWRDPFGNKIEHWTDGDMVNDDTPIGHAEMTPSELSQWAPEITPEFFA